MDKVVISDKTKQVLGKFLKENPPTSLINTYLFYIEDIFNLQPVLFPPTKIIYQSADDAVKALEKEGKLWHENEIKIASDEQMVNEQTRRIYICPFTGKVFGDNTHPNPQDAIYDWVSKCPENKERVGGMRVKRFFVSEDPEVIKNYMQKQIQVEPITKVVYSSAQSGKLFNSKEAVSENFKKNYLKRMSLIEVQSQNRFKIEESFIEFLQKQLEEEKIAAFVQAFADIPEFQEYVQSWLK